jgi:hypothetical protein
MWLYHEGKWEDILTIAGYERKPGLGGTTTVTIGNRNYALAHTVADLGCSIPNLVIYRRMNEEVEFAYFVEIIFSVGVVGVLIIDFSNLLLFLSWFFTKSRKKNEVLTWLLRKDACTL